MNSGVSAMHKTPISYYGGKQSLLSHILPLIPPHEIYTEVFFGGGAVYFAKTPVKNETINDTNDVVINFYRVLKSDYKSLKLMIDQTLISRSMHLQALKIYRHPDKHSKIELAWAFWMVCNFSYANKIGGGVKYSSHQSTAVPDQLRNKKARFTDHLVKRIEHAHIECNEANKVLLSRNVDKAFHYIDPPYFNADMGHYKGFTMNDTIDLFDTIVQLKGKFLLSSYNSDVLGEYVRINGWHKKEITHRLHVPRKGKDTKIEVLIWNYNLHKTLF